MSMQVFGNFGRRTKAPTPLVRLFVDLLWMVVQQVVGLAESCGFVVQLVAGPTAQTPLDRFVVDLLYYLLHNKSAKN
jgi:hypothetical protein